MGCFRKWRMWANLLTPNPQVKCIINSLETDMYKYKTISNKNDLKAKNNFHSKEILRNLALAKNKQLEIKKWCAS